MLLFGDHGYDLDYLEADERNPPLTREQAISVEREEWYEDKRPPAEFRLKWPRANSGTASSLNSRATWAAISFSPITPMIKSSWF